MQIKVVVRVPKQILDMQGVINAIKVEQQLQVAPDVKRLFRSTVVGWKNKPRFVSRQDVKANSISITIHSANPNSDQYYLVNAGAKPHLILAMKAPFLLFQRGYHSSTRPRILSSRPLSRYGSYWLQFSVDHPGFKAREFDDVIAERYRPLFSYYMQRAINRAVHSP